MRDADGYRRPVALLTGASGGIGKVIAPRLVEEGFDIIATVNQPDRMQAVKDSLADVAGMVKALAGEQPDARVLRLDVTSAEQVEVLLEQTPLLDLVVTAHGAPARAPMSAEALDGIDFAHFYDVDVLGTHHVMRSVAERWIERQHPGAMVAIGSFHSVGTYPGRTPYAMAKAGQAQLARSLAVDWGRYGIRVNCIAPGQVDNARTRWFAEQHTGSDLMADMKARAPAYALVDPEDIVQAVLFCARTPSLTGQTIVLDHGVTSSVWHQPYGPGGAGEN